MPGMRRREFVSLFGGAAAWPIAARAQQTLKHIRRVGLLSNFSERDPEVQTRLTAFRTALQETGWVEGVTLRLDYRHSEGDVDRLRKFALELTALAPDVLHGIGSPPTTALKDATRTIPIVFAQVADPMGSGLIDNMARPSGNITGFTNYEYSLGGKWLEVLKEIAPFVARVLVLYNPANISAPGLVRAIEAAAAPLDVQVGTLDVRQASELVRLVDQFAREPAGGLIVLPDGTSATYREDIISRATKQRLPAVYPHRAYTASGGLISYGISTSYQSRQAATYVDRILRGAQPRDLPVQAPTKYELTINLKAARALGLDIPSTLLARADEVIE